MSTQPENCSPFTFADVLREHRRSRPHHVAVVDGAVRLTYPELDERVNRLANWLSSVGCQPGDRVMWLGQNSFRILECLLAAAKLGGIVCPVNWRQSVEELEFVLDDLEPVVVVWQGRELGETAEELRGRDRTGARWVRHDAPAGEGAGDDGYEALLAASPSADPAWEVDPADPLLALYTAAFGGRPNAALLSHRALLTQNLVIGSMQEVTGESVCLNSGPLFHIAGFMTTNATLHHGGTNVFLPRADAEEMCRLIQDERCTHAFVMGPTLEAMEEAVEREGYDLSSLWPGDGARRPGMVCPPTSPWSARPGGFGQTEVVGLATFDALGGTSGRPLPTVQVAIVDPDDVEVPVGEVGEIAVRGATVLSGYHRRPELNAQRSRGGWHHTNDLGRREEDGSVTFVGPKTTIIKSAAENIYPAEVEGCIGSHPDVEAVCVIGVPDPRWTQSVKAVVVPREGARITEDDVIEHCRAHIASYKKPRVVEFAESLPGAPGPIDRAAVDEAYGGGGYPGSQT